METYDLETLPGHLMIMVRDRAVLLDTGSPHSLGTPTEISLAGRTWRLLRDELGLMSRIGTALGHRVDALLGTDVLRGVPLLVDGPAGRVSFDVETPSTGSEIPLTLPCGVPELVLEHHGAAIPAFLDTGAPLSYTTPEAVAGRTPDGTEEDFHPLVGSFTAPFYQLDVIVGGRSHRGRFAVLPAQLAPLRQMIGTRWILGSEFFRDRRIMLDLDRKVAMDVTDQPPTDM